MLLLIIIIIIVIILTFLLIKKDKFEYPKNNLPNYGYFSICKTVKKECKQINTSITKNDILKIYNDLSYNNSNDEELPNGGLLASVISNNYLCTKNYSSLSKNGTCENIENCKVPDLKDINDLLNNTAKENLTSCYSFDTTYLRSDFPSVLFGPLLAKDVPEPLDMNIGLILDISKLRKYIACMGIVDSGSVGRFNFKENKQKQNSYISGLSQGIILPTDITDSDMLNYNTLLNNKKSKGLAQAGCGLQSGFQGDNLSGIFNEEYLHNGDLNKFKGAKKVIVDKYDNITDDKILNAKWGVLKQQMLRRTSWKYFVESLKKKISIINKFGGNSKLWKTLVNKYNTGEFVNLYTENEVDIFIPNKTIENGGENCEVTDEFKTVWDDCVLGIFTNNMCVKDISYNKVCDGCGKLEEYDCSKVKCCCNNTFTEELVKRLVFRYNQGSKKIINGYVMNDDLNPSKDFPKPNSKTGLYDLKIKQLTDYKSYNLIPTLVDKINNNITQYWYKLENTRTVAIAYPNNFNGKYLVHFDFTVDYIAIGSSCNNGKQYGPDKKGGVINLESLNEYCKANNGWDFGFDKYQKYLHSQLQEGIAVISLTECDYDYGAYLPGKDPTGNTECTVYWNDGNNSDAKYMKSLFKNLYCNNFVDKNGAQLNINYENMAILGYSVGAQMVSRIYNNFPSMRTDPDSSGQTFKFPTFKFGIMIGGGSMYCYSVDNYICPSNHTETIYDNGTKSFNNHPCTLLIQSTKDKYADPLASEKYYNTFPSSLRGNSNNYDNNKRVYKTYSESTIHGISSDAQLNDMIKFSKFYF
mgnify:CR=1 FL=1